MPARAAGAVLGIRSLILLAGYVLQKKLTHLVRYVQLFAIKILAPARGLHSVKLKKFANGSIDRRGAHTRKAARTKHPAVTQ